MKKRFEMYNSQANYLYHSEKDNLELSTDELSKVKNELAELKERYRWRDPARETPELECGSIKDGWTVEDGYTVDVEVLTQDHEIFRGYMWFTAGTRARDWSLTGTDGRTADFPCNWIIGWRPLDDNLLDKRLPQGKSKEEAKRDD